MHTIGCIFLAGTATGRHYSLQTVQLPCGYCCKGLHLLLVGHSHDLAKHDSGVAVQEGNAGQTLAGLEAVHNQGLHGLKHNLSHLVSLQAVRLL